MRPVRAQWGMLSGITLLLIAGLLVCWLMAILEIIYPPAGETLSNCWWYGAVKFWKDGGAVVMHWSSYTKLPHFEHTQDFERFFTFNPPSKRHRKKPPPLFNGHIVESTRAEVLNVMRAHDAIRNRRRAADRRRESRRQV